MGSQSPRASLSLSHSLSPQRRAQGLWKQRCWGKSTPEQDIWKRTCTGIGAIARQCQGQLLPSVTEWLALCWALCMKSRKQEVTGGGTSVWRPFRQETKVFHRRPRDISVTSLPEWHPVAVSGCKRSLGKEACLLPSSKSGGRHRDIWLWTGVGSANHRVWFG